MGKTLDNLQTLSRALLLVAATLIATAVYYQPVAYRYSLALEGLDRLTRLYAGFLGDIRADATENYRAQLRSAFTSAPAWKAKIIETAQFIPVSLTVDQKSQIRLPLTNPNLSFAEIFERPHTNPTGAFYYLSTLDAGKFVSLVDDLTQRTTWRDLITAQDLVVEVSDPNPQTGTCDLLFRAESWEQRGRSRLSHKLPCATPTAHNVTDLWGNFYRQSQDQLGFLRGDLKISDGIAMLPISVAHSKLSGLAATETEEETADVLGAKLRVVAVLNIGPMIVIVLLFMMLGQTRVVSTLPDEGLAECAFWFGQFEGWSAILFASVLWLMPILATATATSATYVQPPNLIDVPWYNIELLRAQAWFIGGTLVTLILSTWVVVANWRAAQAWRTRLTAQTTRKRRLSG